MLTEFITKHKLPNEFINKAKYCFMPLAEKILAKKNNQTSPLFVGINGCQGSGKSTLTDFLTEYFSSQHGLTVVNISLDDFYLSKAQRAKLAKTIHPLLATRGVPGSHDIDLLAKTLTSLKKAQPNIRLSRFNKATDDLYPNDEWLAAPNNIDIVLLEGWCWGVVAQAADKLSPPVNNFEKEQDKDAAWRTYVNQQLVKNYQPLYSLMNCWLMLKAPSFSCVENWRWQQEEKLAKTSQGAGVMSKAQVHNFIQYYQRLTEECLTTLPEQCDWVLELDENRQIQKILDKEANMAKLPIIFTDLDGTLLDHFDYSFSKAESVIDELKKRQIPIIPNTSKTFAEMVNIQVSLALDSPFIIENGAAVYIPVGYFKDQPDGTIRQGNYWVKEFCPPRSHWLSLLESVSEQYGDLFQGFSKLSLDELCNLTGLSPESAEFALDRKYTEPLLWHGDNCNKDEFIAHMESLGAHMLQGGRFLHVGGHSDKGLALTWLANVFSKQLKVTVQTIALGDSHNDNEMLEIADIAMQIKSPIHPFPMLNKTNNCFRSTEFGPKGWAECLSNFFFLQQQPLQIGAC
jgi:D-glycerate 3-kinase